VRDPLMYIEQRPIGGRRGHLGATYFAADNPPYGATFTYYLKDKFKTKKETRQEQEKKQPGKEGAQTTENNGKNKKAEDQKGTALHQFQQKVARLNRALTGAVQIGGDVDKRLTAIRQSLRDTPGDMSSLVSRTDDIQNRLRDIMRAMRGDTVLRHRQENTLVA